MVAIESKIQVIRALSAVVARRAIIFFLVIDSLLLSLLLVGIWLLVYYFSSWWWLLLIIYIPLLVASILVYILARFLASRLYRGDISREQRTELSNFTDKIMRLLETRGMGWWWFATLCIRDLLFYRELRTLKELLADTTSLKSDFENLERKLS